MKRIQLIGIALILVISISMVTYASNEEYDIGIGRWCVDFTDYLYQEFGLEIDQQECVVCRNSGNASTHLCLCLMLEQAGILDQYFKNFGQCVKWAEHQSH